MSRKPQNALDAAWESHKNTIYTLYIVRKATLKSLMAHMENVHGFVMSDTQYERQFKKWGFSKNIKLADRKTINRKVKLREKQGKQSVVLKDGEEVPKTTWDKCRHRLSATEEIFEASELPQTPEGFTVCTPRSEQTPLISIHNLPSLMLMRRLMPQTFSPTRVVDSTSRHHASYESLISLGSGDGETTVEVNHRLASAVSEGSGWVSFLTDLDSNPVLASIPGPGGDELDIPSALTSVSRNQDFRHLLSLLHSACNNLLSESQASEVWQVICRDGNRRLFQSLVAKPSPTTQAIARTFLSAAIKSLDFDLLKILLDTGIRPTSRVDVDERPLQIAIRSHSVEMTRFLLDRGADANQVDYRITPLGAAIETRSLDLVQLLLDRRANSRMVDLNEAVRSRQLNLVQLILNAGFNVNDPKSDRGAAAMQCAAGCHDLKLVQLLVCAGFDVNARQSEYEPTALQVAARNERTATVRLLLSHGADPNAAPTERGYSALGYAIGKGNFEMQRLLLSHGAKMTSRDRSISRFVRRPVLIRDIRTLEEFGWYCDTPPSQADIRRKRLQQAVGCGDVELLRSLLGPRIDSDAAAVKSDIRHISALPVAAYNGKIELVQLLLSYGADIDARANSSSHKLHSMITGRRWYASWDIFPQGDIADTALSSAISGNHLELVLILLRSGASFKRSDRYLAVAARHGNLDMVRLLLAHGVKMSGEGGASAIMEALYRGSTELIQFLLEAYVLAGNAGFSGLRGARSPLDVAAEHCGVEVLQLLIDCNAKDKSRAVRKAVKVGNTEAVAFLLASGAAAGQQERERYSWNWTKDRAGNRYRDFTTALCIAAENDRFDVLRLLLEYSTTADDRVQALQVAASLGKVDAARILLEHGVCVNAPPLDLLGRTPRTALQAAAEFGDLTLVQCLLDAGADVESKVTSTRERGTALQFAAIRGHISVATLLFQNGAAVQAPAMWKHGRTTLEGAAEHGRLDMVQLLFNMGAEATGSRALHFARKEGHDGVAALLLDNGFEDSNDQPVDDDELSEYHLWDEYRSDSDCDSDNETLVEDLVA